jgi:methionyl-tRNA formyltransferase
MRVLFWGTPAFALPAFRAVAEEGHDLVAVVTQPDRPAGRGRALSTPAVKEAALAVGIPVLQPERASGEAFLAELRALDPDISVVVAFGQILKPEVLDLPRHGSVNIHGSLLPELRGAAPVQWAVIRGHDTSGVSIMRMDAGLDSGPVLFQVAEPIRPDESAAELALRLSEIGAEALVETLALLEADMVTATPQDDSRATYAPKLDRETARLDWRRPAFEVARWIRGLDDVPGAWSELDGGAVVKLYCPTVEGGAGEPGVVLEAHPERGVLVAAGEGAVRVGEVQPAGKRRMPSAAWVRGRGVAAGARLA